MSDAQIEAFVAGRFTVNDDTIFDLLRSFGAKGAQKGEMWQAYRAGKDLTEDEIHSLQNQIIGRTSELARLGFLRSVSEPYVTDSGAKTRRSRYFIAEVRGPVRPKRTEALQAENDSLKEEVEALKLKLEASEKRYIDLWNFVQQATAPTSPARDG